MKSNAQIDTIFEGKGYGSVADKLLANGMNANALRTNDTLLYEEWKQIDRAVLMAAQQRMVGVAQLMSRGLTYNIPNGLGKTILGYQDMSDQEDAELNMDGISKGRRDRPEFDIHYLPLPIIHKDFSFTAREIEVSRSEGQPLDTTMAAASARKVMEKVEAILFTGASTYTFGGGTIYGLTDYTNRNTGSLTANWDDSAGTGSVILSDILDMKQALLDDRMYGPYGLWIPANFETAVDDDFKANSDRTIRERIMAVENLAFMQVADKLTADNVVMAQLTDDVIRVVNGLNIVTVRWADEGGMRINFKVMCIMIPQIRADQTGKCGVVHYS